MLDPSWGITWILAIVLLTWTIKALLVKPTINQLRSARKMQELQPRMKEIREKYGNDQMRAGEEMKKLYAESGVRPVAGCLPMVAQIPVFIGLFHVLRSFDRTVVVGGAFGHVAEPMSPEQNASIANYIFSPELVRSYVDAEVFGVPLVTNLRANSPLLEGVDIVHAAIIIVPLIIIIAIFTHLNAKLSLARQAKRKAAGKVAPATGQNAEMMEMQTKMMNTMMLWVLPATLVFSGFIWPVGLLFYMLSNTLWTFVQTRMVYSKMDAEEEAEEAAKMEAKRTMAPKPGARKLDRRTKKQRKQK
ncbi:preprotein translocase subunit YidC [Corynebacterium phocae]|uniref:Membrane protein insertase YidC n=1 Tax=Corynebacterium phocae TaxID=161895 RepID=A0A1L7D751_9CORY|nr:preprotein translocase subunit YidC [Corynebacterium phocae]